EKIDVDAFRLSQQRTALLEDSESGRASAGDFDPATHEPPAYGEDDVTGRVERPAPEDQSETPAGEATSGAPAEQVAAASLPSEDERFDPAIHEPPAYAADETAAANE